MDVTQQIQAAAMSGLSKGEFEALIGRKLTDSEIETFSKTKAIYKLKEQKRKSEKKYEHLNVNERVWKFRDKMAAIDNEMDIAFQNVDKNRKQFAKQSVENFIQTYLMDILFEEPPSENFKLALKQMEKALLDSRPYNIELPRGSGKTTAAEAMLLYMLAFGIRKFLVIISNNARSATGILKDIWRVISEKETAFAQDFPEICKPFELCNGATRRRQLYKGIPTEIQKNASNIVFPRLKIDGKELPTSGSVVTVRGITSGIRGMKVGTLRPDAVILDDLQNASMAANPAQVEKIMEIINKDVMNLSSKGKLAVLMTSTPIWADDLCEKIENDVSWKTTKYRAIIEYPTDIQKYGNDGLWGQYFKIFDKENITDSSHEESLQFYKDHFNEMNEGAKIFANRYKESDGHISGIQALLEKRHTIGENAFEAEMQMRPKKMSFALEISAKNILQRIGKNPQLVVPEGYLFVAAATDLNVSYAMTTTIIAFKRDLTSCVLYHGITKVHIDQKLNDIDYNQRVYDKLIEIGNELKSFGVKINGWGIDAGGRNWSTVCEFAKNSMSLVNIPACAMAGKASHIFNPFVKSRLRDAIGRTVLCGDAKEQAIAGSGVKYMFFDSDVYRETAQRAFLSPLGSQGGCQLYNGTPEEHTDFAQQVSNEQIKFVKHRPDGRNEYYWTSREPHDYLDTCSMCFAIASSQGISGSNINRGISLNKQNRHRRRFKIV